MPTWTSNIPSQVKPYANAGAFPATGSVKTIYIAEDTDIAYYWTGSAYQAISIQDLSGLVPYTGATTDVDLGNNDLNAEGIKIKGTAGNGHLNMKHQSSNPSAGGQETVIFAGADGEPRFKNDGNAIEQFASREWVGLQGFQNTPIVVNANITAQNDRVYHVIANATFTDPTPVEGRGYFVVVRFASSCVLGGNSYIAGETIHRIFHSGSWLNIALRPSTYVPISRTINGLDLTANRTLTTANINDSTNRRYVTDAQLTVLGNTSGTNTGDETQSSILSKLGWWKVLDTTDSNILTGVSTETIMKAVELPALTNGSKLKINDIRVTKAGVATCTIKAYINNVNNNLAGAVQILSTGSSFGASGLIATVERTFKIQSGNIRGFSAATGVFTDKNQSTAIPLNATLPTGTLYLIVTLTQAVGESSQVELIDVSNF